MNQLKRSLGRLVAVAALSVIAVMVTVLPASGAGTPYGGGGGGGSTGLPGLQGAVVTTCTFEGPALTCTAVIGGYTISIFMPANSLPVGSQLVISSVNNPQTVSGTILLAFGAGVYLNGTKSTSTFTHPLTVTVTGPNLSSATTVYQQTSSGAVVVASTSSSGSIVFSMPSDPSYQLDNPATPAATNTVSGATLAVTGKPFLGEELLAGALVGFGSLLLISLRLRRRRTPVVVSNES